MVVFKALGPESNTLRVHALGESMELEAQLSEIQHYAAALALGVPQENQDDPFALQRVIARELFCEKSGYVPEGKKLFAGLSVLYGDPVNKKARSVYEEFSAIYPDRPEWCIDHSTLQTVVPRVHFELLDHHGILSSGEFEPYARTLEKRGLKDELFDQALDLGQTHVAEHVDVATANNFDDVTEVLGVIESGIFVPHPDSLPFRG